MVNSTDYIKDKVRGSNRRALLLGGGMAAVLVTLGFRSHFLQVREAEKFRLLAEENRINLRLIPPVRGEIFDRNGILIAGNEQNYSAILIRDGIKNLEEVLRNLQTILLIPDEEIAILKGQILKNRPLIPITVAERLTWKQLSRIAVNSPALPGVSLEVILTRYYPRSTDYSNIVGYVGPVNEKDIKKMEEDFINGLLSDKNPLLEIPNFQVGKTEVESKLDRQLRGLVGVKRVEVNALGRVMRDLDRDESVNGPDIKLTIDTKLQNFVQARLEGIIASAIVMDVINGDLLAIGSTPTFDSNKFVNGISFKDYNSLIENPYRPLGNKAIQGSYPPGSTFKMAVALAALEAGVVEPNEKIRCTGYIELSGRRFHCWKRSGHGNVNFHDSLKQSCDCYYYELAQRLGIEKINLMARRLGLGEKHDIPMSLVQSGLIPSKEWKVRRRGEDWRIGDTLNTAIGQGFVLSSSLQLAVMTARLATNLAVKPRLVKTFAGLELDPEAFSPLGVRSENLLRVQTGMYDVINSSTGTAYGSRIESQKMNLAGKTGTSQVRGISRSEREDGVALNEDLPWKQRDHALFVGYAPFKSPRYAVSVIVEHGGSGSAIAAPIARDIILAAQHDALPPLSAYPESQQARISSAFSKMVLTDPSEILTVKN
jgi:penicillin-binding protein 2